MIDKEYLEMRLKQVNEALVQALEQIQKWEDIARRNEGAVNAINSMLKDIEKDVIEHKIEK